ncbi:MAG: hypothetical protein IJ635_00515 [Bacteroidaceae bacterium]|nr:hypothetical protein [Bacteroidaceae bacterium]
MTEQEKKDIQQKINEVLAVTECPVCHHRDFIIADSYFMNIANDDYTKPQMPSKRTIPAIGVICKHCGFISMHALGILGLMKAEVSTQDKGSVQNE